MATAVAVVAAVMGCGSGGGAADGHADGGCRTALPTTGCRRKFAADLAINRE